ncbi:hypothetical protein Tco_0489874 [Tanacetum coccineum]
MALHSTKFQCTVITKALLPYAATMFNILAQSILISDTTSLKSKWRMESSSFTLSGRNISWRTYSPSLYAKKELNSLDKLGMRSFTPETLGKLKQLLNGDYRDGLQIADMDRMTLSFSASKFLRVLRIILVILLEHQSDTHVFTIKMEILSVSTSNSTAVDAPVMRTASAAAKSCQEDSSEFYLITGSIYTDQRGTLVIATIFDESEQRLFRPYMLIITNLNLQVFPMVAAARRGRVRFITTCSYSTDIYKDIMKAQVHVSRFPLL